MIQYPRYRQHRFSSFQVIIAGFAAVDLVGALLLMLPIAAQQWCVTPFHEALFTSTSALCVRPALWYRIPAATGRLLGRA